MKKWIVAALSLTIFVSAQEKVSPELIQEELVQTESDFQRAEKMFNPWYTGPILAGSATMMAPGQINLQPYVFVTDNFAAYDTNRHSKNTPDLWQVNPQLVAQTGLNYWMDIATVPQMFVNEKQGRTYTMFGDLPVQIGFRLVNQGIYMPKMKITINELFPTGTYQKLSPGKRGTDITGGGSFVTGASFRIGKLFFWWTQHPLNTRLVLTYNIPTTVHVQGYNAYGGGKGTKGKVRPGNSFQADLGLEWSLAQKWVLATDIVYQANNRTTFNGQKGINPTTGKSNVVGSGSSDYLEIAPAIEYNHSDVLGIIGGVWFTVYGRNTSNFISYVLSLTYTFDVKSKG